MKQSLVMVAPVAWLPQANAMLHGLGWADDNFSVPLLAEGEAQPSHFGLRASVDASFATALEQSLVALPALAAVLITDIRDDAERQGQFNAVIQVAGLSVVVPTVA